MASERERDPGSSSAEIGKYLDILAKDPNSRVFAPLAEAYRKAGLFDDAVEIALEGLKVHPNYLGGRVALGRAYFEKKQFPEASAEMQKVAKAAPDNIIAHKVLGQIAYSQNNLPAAEKAFKMVLLLDPRDQEAQEFITNLAGGALAASVPVQPAQAMPSPPAPPPPTPPAPSPPAPSRVPPPSEPLLFDEIQTLEDIDLQAEDIFGEPPPAPAGGMELEVFSRVPWGGAAGIVESPPPSSMPLPVQAAPAPPVAAAQEQESPFEVFGRPQPGGPPQSTRGEPVAFGEIDFESTVDEPAPREPAPDAESSFEVFTREPGPRAAQAQARDERRGEAGPREIDVETTAYTPSDTFVLAGVDDPVLSLDEELPRIDLTQEMDFGLEDRAAPSPAGLESWPESPLAPEPEPEPEPEPGMGTGMDLEVDFESEEEAPSPPQGWAQEQRLDPFGEEYEDTVPEDDLPEEEPGRGVFDTETLASIYVDQGFYGRAAEIYQRLIAQRPDDPGLREKLESALALERGKAGDEESAAAVASADGQYSSPAPVAHGVAEPAVAMSTGPERMISQLQTLLETFKEGRPR